MGFPGNIECRNVQLIEPDNQLLVATSSGSADSSLDESGSTNLSPGFGEVTIPFVTPKAGAYRFEYLYIDALGEINPGGIIVVPVTQTSLGFTVDLTGVPLDFGYILRWRVVVIEIGQAVIPSVDAPVSLYLQLPQTHAFHVTFATPRTRSDYGFSELRIENLIDLPGAQTPIAVQVVAKNQFGFTVELNPTPPTSNYFMAVRIP